MSIEALRWARLEREGIRGPAQAVLRDLADRANDDGTCWPSVATIATSTGLCERTVRTALRRLDKVGLIAIKRTGRNSIYMLNFADQIGRICTSDRQEMPIRAAGDAPKASRSKREANTRTREEEREPRQNAAAYRPPELAADASDAPDPKVIQKMRQWLEQGGKAIP